MTNYDLTLNEINCILYLIQFYDESHEKEYKENNKIGKQRTKIYKNLTNKLIK